MINHVVRLKLPSKTRRGSDYVELPMRSEGDAIALKETLALKRPDIHICATYPQLANLSVNEALMMLKEYNEPPAPTICDCAKVGVPEGFICGKPDCPRVIAIRTNLKDMLS